MRVHAWAEQPQAHRWTAPTCHPQYPSQSLKAILPDLLWAAAQKSFLQLCCPACRRSLCRTAHASSPAHPHSMLQPAALCWPSRKAQHSHCPCLRWLQHVPAWRASPGQQSCSCQRCLRSPQRMHLHKPGQCSRHHAIGTLHASDSKSVCLKETSNPLECTGSAAG